MSINDDDSNNNKPQVGQKIATWLHPQSETRHGAGPGTIIDVDADGETALVELSDGGRYTLKRHIGPDRPAMSWDYIY